MLQFAASGPAQPGAASAEIVRRELRDADLGGKLLDDVPDEFLRHPFAPNFARAAHAAKEAAAGNSSGFHPVVQETMDPIRDGDRSNVPGLPTQVYDCPMPFALLEMANSQPGEFVPTEPASKQYAE